MHSDEPKKQVEPKQDDTASKQPYVRPRILSREPLEVMAVSCSPIPPGKGTEGLCNPAALQS